MFWFQFERNVDVKKVDLEVERTAEKMRGVEERIEELEDEKKIVSMHARDEDLRIKASAVLVESNVPPESEQRNPVCVCMCVCYQRGNYFNFCPVYFGV